MAQTLISAATDEKTARGMMLHLDTIFDEEGLPVSAFEDPDKSGHWNIAVYCETTQAESVMARMLEAAKASGFSPPFKREDLPETDWVAETLRELAPVRAGRFIVHGSHDRDIPRPHDIGLLIDAGLAFGTGHHGTTAGCLDMLDKISRKRRFYNALDLGTGSGVLAIAMAKTMNARILATDIDPLATLTTRDNARINQVHPIVRAETCNGLNHRQIADRNPFDLIVANILARPLQQMAGDISGNLASGGVLILSGLLPHQRARILATFRLYGLAHQHSHVRDGWLTLVLGKRQNKKAA